MTQTSIFPRVQTLMRIIYICILPWHSAVTICVGKLPFRHVYFQVRSFVEGKTTTLVGYTAAVATGFPYDGRLLWYL